MQTASIYRPSSQAHPRPALPNRITPNRQSRARDSVTAPVGASARDVINSRDVMSARENARSSTNAVHSVNPQASMRMYDVRRLNSRADTEPTGIYVLPRQSPRMRTENGRITPYRSQTNSQTLRASHLSNSGRVSRQQNIYDYTSSKKDNFADSVDVFRVFSRPSASSRAAPTQQEYKPLPERNVYHVKSSASYHRSKTPTGSTNSTTNKSRLSGRQSSNRASLIRSTADASFVVFIDAVVNLYFSKSDYASTCYCDSLVSMELTTHSPIVFTTFFLRNLIYQLSVQSSTSHLRHKIWQRKYPIYWKLCWFRMEKNCHFLILSVLSTGTFRQKKSAARSIYLKSMCQPKATAAMRLA